VCEPIGWILLQGLWDCFVEGYEALHRPGWRGWVDRSVSGELPDDPLTLMTRPGAELIRQRATATTAKTLLGERVVFAKRITGIKDRDPSNREWWNWLRWRFGSPRSVRNIAITRSMAAAGIDVPRVLLAARRVIHGTPIEILVTEAVPGSLLWDHLGTVDRVERIALFELAGRAVALMHRAGFIHGDLSPANLIVHDHRIVFLDNDRTRWRPGGLWSYYFRRNLVQMLARSWGRWSWCEVRRFRNAYEEVRGCWPRDTWALILRRMRHRRYDIEQSVRQRGLIPETSKKA